MSHHTVNNRMLEAGRDGEKVQHHVAVGGHRPARKGSSRPDHNKPHASHPSRSRRRLRHLLPVSAQNDGRRMKFVCLRISSQNTHRFSTEPLAMMQIHLNQEQGHSFQPKQSCSPPGRHSIPLLSRWQHEHRAEVGPRHGNRSSRSAINAASCRHIRPYRGSPSKLSKPRCK